MSLWNRWQQYFDLSARKIGFRSDYSSRESKSIEEEAASFGISQEESRAIFDAHVHVQLTTGPYARKVAIPMLLFIATQIFQPNLLSDPSLLSNILGVAFALVALILSFLDWRSPYIAYSKVVMHAFVALSYISRTGRRRTATTNMQNNKQRAYVLHAINFGNREVRRSAWIISSELTYLQTGSRTLISAQLKNGYSRAINNATVQPNNRSAQEEAKRACIELIRNMLSRDAARLLHVDFLTEAPDLVPRRFAWKAANLIRPLRVPVMVVIIGAIATTLLRMIVK